MPRFEQLDDWLVWQASLHPNAIDLGLSRVYAVAVRLGLLGAPAVSVRRDGDVFSGPLSAGGVQVISVAGTNGKGSCVAVLEQCLLSQGLSVGSYTTPHLHHYCERIRIDGRPVAEAALCDAFAVIDSAREDISLTAFEFGTLAALWLFVQAQLPYVLLEVGLGGRLDAVNLVDADVAIITSIDLDHQAWLGDDRDTIAKEKLGIARADKPLVLAETDLTASLQAALECYPVKLFGRDYHTSISADGRWCFHYEDQHYYLPKLNLSAVSVGAALMALRLLELLPTPQCLARLMVGLSLPGRFESHTINNRLFVFDVAHNPAAAHLLSQRLQQLPCAGATLAVFTMLSDKDHEAVIDAVQACIERWYIAGLDDNERALDRRVLRKALVVRKQQVEDFADIKTACAAALTAAGEGDRIVVFGSFLTVAAIQAEYLPENKSCKKHVNNV